MIRSIATGFAGDVLWRLSEVLWVWLRSCRRRARQCWRAAGAFGRVPAKGGP